MLSVSVYTGMGTVYNSSDPQNIGHHCVLQMVLQLVSSTNELLFIIILGEKVTNKDEDLSLSIFLLLACILSILMLFYPPDLHGRHILL